MIPLVPGPGEYSPVDSVIRAPARCLFGMARRFARSQYDDAPGPCEYTPRNPNITRERKTIGEKLRVMLPEACAVTPGPGAYETLMTSARGGKAVSFSGAPSRQNAQRGANIGQDSPGPATYQQQRRGEQMNCELAHCSARALAWLTLV